MQHYTFLLPNIKLIILYKILTQLMNAHKCIEILITEAKLIFSSHMLFFKELINNVHSLALMMTIERSQVKYYNEIKNKIAKPLKVKIKLYEYIFSRRTQILRAISQYKK